MFKRARWTAIGYAAGLGTSYAVARKLRREFQKLGPAHIGHEVSERVHAAVADGRDEMRRREMELRRGYEPRPLRAVPGRAHGQ